MLLVNFCPPQTRRALKHTVLSVPPRPTHLVGKDKQP